ncbi:MAG: AAA family ATPase [Patescibacteria group bacterium]
MQLKSLEINGFKSFAKKGILQFNSSITAIVGPNGSGKSNVAESFRFVLGEQSIKSMRGKKGEDLIFNGGKDTPRSNRGSVKVVFDNANRMFNIDFDEVALERVVHRDGVNEYYINGTQVRLKDVVELLAYANIGSSGHHIISQGEADRLLSAQPLERREMIEDALGLKVYQYKKEESEKKLEKTAEHMKEVESLRREIAPHIKFLRKQVEKIEKAQTLKQELITMYQEYFRREEAYIKLERARIVDDRRIPSEELEKLQGEMSGHKSLLAAAQKENSKSSELITLESQIRETRSKKDSLTRELGRLEGELAYLKRAIDKKIRDAAEASQKQIYLAEVEKLSREIDQKVAAALLIEEVVALKQALEEVRVLWGEFLKYHKSTEAAADVVAEQGEIDRVNSEMKRFEVNLQDVGDAEIRQADAYARIKLDIDKEKDKNVESEKAILRIMSRQNELHSQLEHIKFRDERIRAAEEDWKHDMEEATMITNRDAIFYEKIELAIMPEDVKHAIEVEPREVQTERRRAIEKNKIRLEEMGGAGGDETMREYKEAEERDAFLGRELEDLQKSSETLTQMIAELTDKLNIMFKEGIRKINAEFEKFFRLMFGGGDARLDIVKEERRRRRKTDILGEDDLSDILASSGEEEESVQEGIDIYVALPHKRTKGLMMLSGGERALTSIALLFAMSQVNPPPFIILDETDAALDEANSRKYGDMIESLSKHSQLILITHNRETMSRAGVIYGVTMGGEGHSKLLSIALDDAVAVAK